MRLVYQVLMVLALVVVTALAELGGGAAGAAEAGVVVDNFYFCSQSSQGGVCETTINVGDTVKWEVEGGTHTVTECDDSFSICPPSGGFASGNLSAGGDFSHAFTAAGVFEYRCDIHPSLMRGRITVVAQDTPTPTPAATATPATTAAPVATPAGVPAAGGPNTSSEVPWESLLAAIGVLILVGSVALSPKFRRR